VEKEVLGGGKRPSAAKKGLVCPKTPGGIGQREVKRDAATKGEKRRQPWTTGEKGKRFQHQAYNKREKREGRRKAAEVIGERGKKEKKMRKNVHSHARSFIKGHKRAAIFLKKKNKLSLGQLRDRRGIQWRGGGEKGGGHIST